MCFRIISEHKVNAIFSVPTAFRVIRREDPDIEFGRKYSMKSLRTIFVAGEHCDYETKFWAEKTFNVPVLNHWWQTETGHAITATCVGLDHSLTPPKYTCGMPFPGYDGRSRLLRLYRIHVYAITVSVRILREDGTEAAKHELGRVVIKLPLPPGMMSTLYQAPERFCQVYFMKHPVCFDINISNYQTIRIFVILCTTFTD